MDMEQLQQKYINVPQELKNLKRWVCWSKELRDGKETKVPVNAITGDHAKCDDKLTWTSFYVAIKGCIKYGCEGLGFQLGDGIFGIDLDNHADVHTGKKPMTPDQFKALTDEFVHALDSYSEYSQSGEGIHIICYGTLPDGRKRKNNVEMYDRGRFFAFTGNVINQKPIEERTKEVIPLWSKYVDDVNEIESNQNTLPFEYQRDPNAKYDFYADSGDIEVATVDPNRALSDSEVIEKASKSRSGSEFSMLYHGDMTGYNNDHSSADMALCSRLAFWTNGNKEQIDRLFRASALMRPKWDEKRGKDTYGNITIENAIKHTQSGYQPNEKQSTYAPASHQNIVAEKTSAESSDNFMNIDENGEPIFRIKIIIKDYEYTDTGNAERFYDYFGDIFKYNKDDKMFMFWTGKTWVHDIKDIIRKYANKLIEIMQDEASHLRQDLASASSSADDNGEISDTSSSDKAKAIQSKITACEKNITRLANKAGKDAMLSELQSIHDIPCRNVEFDQDIYKLNTDSGIVDLRTGKIEGFDKKMMLSKNTGIKVSFDEPTEWINFLHGIFDRGTSDQAKQETNEIISCLQSCLGYSLTGSTREQVMFLMYGSGSNGKSTFAEEMATVMGDYGKSIDSSLLMAQGTAQNTSIQFSLAELIGARYLVTKETDEGQKLAEGTVKSLTGSDQINAQQKFGRPFQFMPEFKLWMMTNNLPIIRGTDFGIWRRIFLFPFIKHFTDKEKDLDMPDKLKKESDRILGWCIKGFAQYQKDGRLVQPQCLQDALVNYKNDMDVVAKFIAKECYVNVNAETMSKDMYTAFKNWAMMNNEFALRESKFSAEIEKKGFSLSKNDQGILAYKGIGLNDPTDRGYSSSAPYNFGKGNGGYYDD
jgi:putative DNA primase/helicase